MKTTVTFLLAMLASVCGQTSASYYNLIRQTQQGSNVVWDMPVAEKGNSPSALTLENGGALFQLWTIDRNTAADYLLDQKLVGAYLPTASVTVSTLDPGGRVPRTRVDQPFTVTVEIAGLLNGSDMPLAASSVLLERHLASYQNGSTSIDPEAAISGNPLSSALLSANGPNVLRFQASSLTAADPTKASGEEHFVVHALSDGSFTQTQIASGMVQVWPVASGEIKGINDGDRFQFQTPQVELLLKDLYPRSDTYLMLFEGTQINGNPGTIVKSFPLDRDVSHSTEISVTELDTMIVKDGTYTLALVSETVFGRELLCQTVTFKIDRTLRINAMQVTQNNGNEP